MFIYKLLATLRFSRAVDGGYHSNKQFIYKHLHLQLEWIILRVEFSISVNSLRNFKIQYLKNQAIF